MSVRVLLVDDNELLRAGLRTVLTSDPGLDVVGEAADAATAIRLATDLRPDVVLLDVEMPGGDGITAIPRLLAGSPSSRVLILTMFDLDANVLEALRTGAAGFLLKTTAPYALISAVTACAAGETVVGPTVMSRLVASYTTGSVGSPEDPRLARLTERERDVLRSMAHGRSNVEIGAELFLAETTVKTHVTRILAKLEVRDRLQAVVLAHRHGLGGST